MSDSQKPYKPGTWIVLGPVLGSFLGLVFGKFALGMSFGFFAGLYIDSKKRKIASQGSQRKSEDRSSESP